MYYLLDENNEPYEVEDVVMWAKGFRACRDKVHLTDTIAGLVISTVFLGIDHSFKENAPPILWESMTFTVDSEDKRWIGEQQWRYNSFRNAVKGHIAIMNRVERMYTAPKRKPAYGVNLVKSRRIIFLGEEH